MLVNPQCKTCHAPLLVKSTKPSASKLMKQYYYSHYYYCSKCQKMYLNDKFKVKNENVELFTSQNSPKSKAEVDIWTDGACSNNGKESARASWAFVAGDYEDAGIVDGKQTNNRGEALAIYHALSWAVEKEYKFIKIYTDSQITLHGVAKHPDLVKENRDIFQRIHSVISKNNLLIEYVKVLGHSGDPNNDRADKLAVRLTLP